MPTTALGPGKHLGIPTGIVRTYMPWGKAGVRQKGSAQGVSRDCRAGLRRPLTPNSSPGPRDSQRQGPKARVQEVRE